MSYGDGVYVLFWYDYGDYVMKLKCWFYALNGDF